MKTVTRSTPHCAEETAPEDTPGLPQEIVKETLTE